MNGVDKLEAVFNDIANTRMAGLSICNPAIRVQAVGFREWQGYWTGVLVTPWTISLMLLGGPVPPVRETNVRREYPSGIYEFMRMDEPALGECWTCPLISPVAEVACQDVAVSIAVQVMDALFTHQQEHIDHKDGMEAARLNGEAIAAQPLSRRDFLRGRFLGT